MVNQLRALAEQVGPLPTVTLCADPADNFLLAMAEAGKAHYLVTGDRQHLLGLERYQRTRIITAKAAAEMLGR